jgi:molybdopterin biosynthesis enzyme
MSSPSYQTPAALYKMLPVKEALELVLSQVTRTKPAFECRIQESVGHVLAKDVIAQVAIPDKPLSIKVSELK